MRTLLLCLILVPAGAFADLDKHSKQGLKDTQQLLRDKDERQDYIQKDKRAQDVDKKVDALTGGRADKEEIYDIAAKVMEKVTQESGGDPQKMQMLLLEAQRDPQAFYKKMFSPEERARVKALADKIEKKQGHPGPAK